jgi:hypothetical protein
MGLVAFGAAAGTLCACNAPENQSGVETTCSIPARFTYCVNDAGTNGTEFDCSGDASPGTNEGTCTVAAQQGGTTVYCCAYVPPTCSVDPSGQACADAGAGTSYLCDPGATPQVGGSAVCSAQRFNSNNQAPYCCLDYGTVGCTPGGVFCLNNGSGFYCVDGGVPSQVNPALGCESSSVPAAIGEGYCCGAMGSCSDNGTYLNVATSHLYECPEYTQPPVDAASTTCANLGTNPNSTTDYSCTPGNCTPFSGNQGLFYQGACVYPSIPVYCVDGGAPTALDPAWQCPLLMPTDTQGFYCCSTP